MITKTLYRLLGINLALLGMTPLSQAEEKVRARDLFLAGHDAQVISKSDHPVGSKSDQTTEKSKTPSPVPLGLRYSILKQMGKDQVVEVDSDSVFRSGERIRLSIQANDQGYLYIVSRGTSGEWSPLFPSREILGGNNVVEKGKQYEIPLGNIWFAFDERPGVEKLFIVLSRQPEPDLEKLIRSLRQDEKTTPAQEATGTRKENKGGSVQVVSSLDDATVGKIRGKVASRDLVFEKVNEEKADGKNEKAVYVVNQTGRADSRVVVDVSLNHR